MTGLLLALTVLSAANEAPSIDFDNQVIPVLTKAGCNAGSCHGAAAGRGGFRLSLYGGNPDSDYRSIVRELEGRRVNIARPYESLLILKPTEAIDHEGGYRLEYDGEGAEILRQWIEQGASRLQSKRLARFDVSPQLFVVGSNPTSVPLSAVAEFTDGSKADVTAWTVFKAEDDAAVRIDSAAATATLLRRGRHLVIARYLDQVVPLELIWPLDNSHHVAPTRSQDNFIDDYVLKRLAVLGIPVSPQADDATFLRRVHLDLTGRLPATERLHQFLQDPRPDRRRQWVDLLLSSDEFVEYWSFRLAKLLRIRAQPNDEQGAHAYFDWLKSQIADQVPYDQMARELILAVGDSHLVGPANFYRTSPGPREQAEFTSELFMGTRLRCANCHNHPLDHWTQDDYHGLAAIFAKLQRGRVVAVSDRGSVTHPRTGEPAVQRIPGDRFLTVDGDARVDFANWLTQSDNPYFAKAIVNRLWKALMGRGLVEPPDDFRVTNPATHPELLDDLAADFVSHGYDLRHTLRRIAHSETYARSPISLPDNQTDRQYYSHALTRALEPEVLADAISDVLQVPEPYGELPLGTRAIAVYDASVASDSLDILGRCRRQESCETNDSARENLARTLHLFNGPLINKRLANRGGRLAIQMDRSAPVEQVIDEFYWQALGRPPDVPELEFWNSKLLAADNPAVRQQILEDFVWSLLACQEFVTNH